MGNIGELIYLDYSDIEVVPGRNTRFELGDLEELATSIIDNGIRQPTEVQKVNGKYELVNGHRRLAGVEVAIRRLKDQGVKTPKIQIPALVKKQMTEEELAAEMLICNDGKPFLPLEEAMMLKRLADKGENVKQIAKRIGKSVSHVSDRLALIGAAPEVQEAVKDGSLSTSDAVTIARKIDSPKVQAEFVGKVKTQGTKIVHKELKKGRLQKHQWDSAEDVFGDFQSATGEPLVLGDDELSIDDLKTFSTIQTLINSSPAFDLAYQFGRLAGMSELANLTPAELANKLQDRLTGRPGSYKD